MGRLALLFTRVYLDSNIFISAALGEDRAIASALEAFVTSASASRQPFATSELTLSEVLVRPFRSRDDETARQYLDLVSPSGWLEVKEVDRDVLVGAARLRALYQHLKLPDAVHVAAASLLGCSHLLTDDQGLRGSYQLADQLPPMAVIRPTTETFEAILSWLGK